VEGSPTAGLSPSAGPRPEEIKAVPVKHPGRWVAAAVVLVLFAMLVHALVTNPRFHWETVGQYFAAHEIIAGLGRTLELTVVAMAIGVILGTVLAVLRLSPNPLLSGGAWVYIWVFRGTPVLVQILFWSYIGALYPKISLGIPFGHAFWTGNTNSLISLFMAGILGLGLNEAAYMAEIVRAGMISVDEGQDDAACALGMTRLQTLRRIVLPQAMRVIIPPTGNETISMLKTSSLVSAIAVPELLYTAQLIYSVNYRTIQLLMVASFWYLILTSVLTVIQYYIERRFARGNRTPPPTFLQRLRANLTAIRPRRDLGDGRLS